MEKQELYNVYVMTIEPHHYNIDAEDTDQIQQIINSPVMNEVEERLFKTNGYKLILQGMSYTILGSIYQGVDAKTVKIIESMGIHLPFDSKIWHTSHSMPIPEINSKYSQDVELEILEVCAKRIKIL